MTVFTPDWKLTVGGVDYTDITIADVQEDLGSGVAKDYADYRYICGILHGMLAVKRYVEDAAIDLVNGSSYVTATISLMFHRRDQDKSQAIKILVI